MKTLKTILPILILLSLMGIPKQSQAGDTEIKTIEMIGTNDLTFSVENIEATPGQKIRVVLTTKTSFPKIAMAHNFVLLKAGADATEVANKSARASDNEYIAPEVEDQILAYTGLAGKGETVEVTFTVPEKTGTYKYVCTFPGHYAGGMVGTLTVKEQAI